MNYISLFYRIITALLFTVMVARRLNISEFGLWGIILSLAAMLATPTSLWIFWAQRFYVRGWKEAAGTGLIITFIYILPAIIIYLIISLLEKSAIGWGFEYFLLAIPIIILQIIANYMFSLIAVTKPEVGAYAAILSNSLKLLVAYFLVVILGMKLRGVIITISISIFITIIYLTIILIKIDVLSLSFSIRLVKEWLNAAYIPFLSFLVELLRSSLRTIVSLIVKSELPVAYLNVGFSTEGPLIQAARASSPALYARALRQKKKEDLEETLRFYLFFIGFMFATYFSLSKTIASLYNPKYISAHIIIPLVALYAILNGFSDIYDTAIRGVEKVDASGVLRLKELLSSMLFKIPIVRLASLITSYMLFLLLLSFLSLTDPIIISIIVVITLIAGSIILATYLLLNVHRLFSYTFPFREAITIMLASLFTIIYYFISGAATLEITSFWEKAPLLLFHIFDGFVIYIIVTYCFSPWLRKLVKDSLLYIRSHILHF